ncbi:MAG: hypothetical protein ACI9R3_002819 [Verrucomicrobiales bacterium]|jgi:uncharacterized protein YceK
MANNHWLTDPRTMKLKLTCTLFFACFVTLFSGCSSLRKSDPGDQDYFQKKSRRSMGEKVSDWWDNSKKREDKKFDRMFDRATG